jgi:hypothetical protein
MNRLVLDLSSSVVRHVRWSLLGAALRRPDSVELENMEFQAPRGFKLVLGDLTPACSHAGLISCG